MTDEILTALREAADRICDEAFAARDTIKGPINWGDLGCVRAEYYVADDGVKGYRVLIEEAHHDNAELHEFIAAKLREAGYPDVEIQTEW